MTTARGRGRRIALWIIGILVGLLVLALVGINVYVRVTYSTFYAQAQREFAIPGVNEGFVCQDLDYCDAADCWLFSGYATSGGPSPLYRLDADGGTVEFFAQLPDGSTYEDHGSAITTSDDYAFLACENGYLVFDATDLEQAGQGDAVRAIDRVDLDITPAFANIENGILYLGTFHLIPDYPAPPQHHLLAPDGSENAGVVLVYPPDAQGPYGFATQASCAYSIPDAAQGICAFDDGSIMLSSSFGLSSSHLRTYRPDTASADGTFLVDGREVPLRFLDSTNLVSDLVAPPMSEGIEYHDGRVYVSEESASNKYLFGKLYGAGSVYSIGLQELLGDRTP